MYEQIVKLCIHECTSSKEGRTTCACLTTHGKADQRADGKSLKKRCQKLSSQQKHDDNGNLAVSAVQQLVQSSDR
jgi:hypothetical protein